MSSAKKRILLKLSLTIWAKGRKLKYLQIPCRLSIVKPVFNDIKHGILFKNWQDGACWSLGLYTKNEQEPILWLESQSIHCTLTACVSQIALRKQYSRGFVNQNNFSGESRGKTGSSRWNFSSRVFQATFGMKSEAMHLHGIPTFGIEAR